MARRARAAETETETEAATPSEVIKTISGPKLKNLLKAARATKKDVAEISGALGKKIAAAVESDGLHRKAFNVCRMADAMENEKMRDFFDHLDHYREISGLNERAATVQSMDFGDDDDDNVEQFPARDSVAAE